MVDLPVEGNALVAHETIPNDAILLHLVKARVGI
jgi:hypothetical protein